MYIHIHMYLDLCFTSGDVIMYSLVVYTMYILTNRLLWTGSDLQSSCSAWPCPFHAGGSRYRPALQSEWTNPHRQASPSSRSPVKGIKRMLLYYFEFFLTGQYLAFTCCFVLVGLCFGVFIVKERVIRNSKTSIIDGNMVKRYFYTQFWWGKRQEYYWTPQFGIDILIWPLTTAIDK